ncbi:LysR family transcriptional regulator [Sinomonas humi]|uniref:HTH lysR-type domain-containing protein n=1 Tax=Sinomonas humi TaxID=1338436 RepID=A0A0B2ANR2_9MICC|nr:LysR family transcriptional regulator [Sinomonas humi]KHL05321.1 hypothetical protein LK10_01585 [Sinomonas humi]
MLSIHRLRLLVELNRRGTVTEVARALSYRPSTISQQLAQLEREAGSRLIEPTGRRVRLTAAGEMLVRHAEVILVQIDRAEADLARARAEIGGEVRVATFQTAAIALVPSLLENLQRSHPDVTVYLSEIQPDAGNSALLARDFDLVLGEVYPGPPSKPSSGIEQQHLFSDPMRCYAPSRWLGDSTLVQDLARYPWVMEPRGKPARAWAEALCRAAGFEPNVRFESADLLVHVMLAETGHAVALLPDLVWTARTPRATLLPLPDSPAREVYTAVRLGSETKPILVELRRALAEVAGALLAHLPEG